MLGRGCMSVTAVPTAVGAVRIARRGTSIAPKVSRASAISVLFASAASTAAPLMLLLLEFRSLLYSKTVTISKSFKRAAGIADDQYLKDLPGGILWKAVREYLTENQG